MVLKFHLTESNKPYLFAKLQSLDSTKDYYVNVTEYDSRTLEQNAKIHAMLGDIAKQSRHLNQVLGADDWKRLCVAQFRTDCIRNDLPKLADYWKRNEFRLMPSLDGQSAGRARNSNAGYADLCNEWIYRVAFVLWRRKRYSMVE
jgi:hypothetical protein